MKAESLLPPRNLSALGFDQIVRNELRGHASHVATMIRLSFKDTLWRGNQGNWQGVGVGSSIDFQDHRQYLPGDDPRYINWQAYARTGSYTMKLYREEVSPQLDIVLDTSASMFLYPDKGRRVLEVFHFIVASARMAGAKLRCYVSSPRGSRPVSVEAVEACAWDIQATDAPPKNEIPDFQSIPWRNQALRIVITDLLFASSPDEVLAGLARKQSRLLFFVPWCDQEARPEWLGNVELSNCETHVKEDVRFSSECIQEYAQNYRQHFSIWHEACAKRGYGFARLAADGLLEDVLLKEPLKAGLVELWN